MTNWVIDNGIIVFSGDNTNYIPKASEIFEANETGLFMLNGQSYVAPKNELDIRFSRFGVVIKTRLVYENNLINLKLFAIKQNAEYEVLNKNGTFLDYIIIGNVWHYLDGNFNAIVEVLEKLKIDLSDGVSYTEYMSLTREFHACGIEYEDEIITVTENIKENNQTFTVEGLRANLFPYQERGCNWLAFMQDNQCGCILGDEMGLGKTLQIIALFAKVKQKDKKAIFLVVAPISLLENWRREIEKFYPSLKVLVHHGSHRTGSYYDLLNYDVVVMSYSNVQTDLSMLEMITWDILVLDEAQNIKNPYAMRTKNVKLLKKDMAIAVTGTPFENHMTDIWSLVDFVLPGYLGKLSQYESVYKDDLDSAARIEQLITPIMIRRRVKNVAKDLPERVDIPQPILMTEDEANLYEAKRKDVAHSNPLNTLTIDTIQGLRMFCTHPLVYDDSIKNKDPIQTSNKYFRLCDILSEVIANGEKAIVFTSFNKMIELLGADIEKRFGVKTWFINGSVSPNDRQRIVDDYSNHDGSAVLILNPRAAGTGLNITAANHVIHYNLEWNPAVEDQASARAYRRGQTKTVFVHRLFYSNTVEEIINDRIQRKREMSDLAIVGNVGSMDDRADLLKALSLSPIGGVHE